MSSPGQQARYFSGICSRFSEGDRSGKTTMYRAELVPAFWLLTKTRDRRIFQDTSVPEILRNVLGGLDVDYRLQVSYEPRNYCVQYRESDFDFASRLMEEEGIFYFFNHSDGGHLSYANTFRCVPSALPFRPPRTTPIPTAGGPETAVVVGPAGEEIYTDKYGRVKVQFHWDREGKHDDRSSCWIRVAQPVVQGPQVSPMIGDEVVVAFEDGDPDRPIAIGRLHP